MNSGVKNFNLESWKAGSAPGTARSAEPLVLRGRGWEMDGMDLMDGMDGMRNVQADELRPGGRRSRGSATLPG